MFKITSPHGFHIGFENGFSVSVQFGGGNYGSNYDDKILPREDEPFKKAKTAEVAVIHEKRGMLYWKGEDTVEGYVSCKNVAKLIFYVSNLPDDWEGEIDWDKMLLSEMNMHLKESVLKRI